LSDKLWYPPREMVETANVSELMDRLGIRDYRGLVKESLRRYEWFWGRLPEWLGIEWFREPRQVLDASKGPEWTRWYLGSRLNLAWLAVAALAHIVDVQSFTLMLGLVVHGIMVVERAALSLVGSHGAEVKSFPHLTDTYCQ